MSVVAPSIRHLRDFVAIPSVNPMGRSDLSSSLTGESRLAEQLCAVLRRLGVDAGLVGEAPRQSVVAEVLARDPRAETIVVASHLDTVPVDGMEIAPFDPRIEAGRLYGRGSCDTKAGLAALCAALERMLPHGGLRHHLIIVGEADEEKSSLGVHDVLASLAGRRPAFVLATEPTELAVVHAHKGVVHAVLEARGVAGHASAPRPGENAIVALARVALELEALGLALASREHPSLGAATLSIGQFEGGLAPNVVPDRARLVVDRRVLPGESLEQVERELAAAIERAGEGERVRVASCRLEKPALGTSLEHLAVRHCAEALRAAAHPVRTGSVAFGTDAGVFEAEAGWPGVVMGPGSIQQAHTNREYVEVAQVETMTDFFVALLGRR